MVNKKIAIDLSWIKIDKSGGVENHTINLLKNLKSKNIYYFVTPNQLVNKKYTWIRGKNIKTLTNFYLINIFYIFFLSHFFLKKNKINKFFSTNIYCPLIQKKNIKIKITLHHAMWLVFPGYYSIIKRWFYDIYYNFLNEKVNFIAISNHIRDKFKKKFKFKNIKVIYNPIVIKKKNTKLNFLKNKKYFFYLASNEPHKNLNTIIKAFNSKNIKKEYNLVIAGYGQKNKIISNNIFILGKISEEKKYSLYKNCLCYIHPSLYEGFGMPLVEAMLLNKKIITNTNGSIREITLNKAIYIKNPKDHKSWIRKINKFNYLKFFKINIKKINKTYNYKNILKIYYKEIFNEN